MSKFLPAERRRSAQSIPAYDDGAKDGIGCPETGPRPVEYDVVSIGYAGPIVHHRPMAEPYNLGGRYAEWIQAFKAARAV